MKNEDLTNALARLMAWVDATQPLIEALIITHPDAVKLRDAWHRQLPERVEGSADTAPFAVTEYREKLLRNLGDISSWLDGLAGHTGAGST